MNKLLAVLFMIVSRVALIMYLIPWVHRHPLDECIAAGVIYILASMSLTRIEMEIAK